MKRILPILAMILAFHGVSLASPFLVCDPNPGAGWYEITNLPAQVDGSHVLAQSDGSIRLDFANIPVGGPYSIQIRACTVWGCSSYAPFVFSRPDGVSGASGIRLIR